MSKFIFKPGKPEFLEIGMAIHTAFRKNVDSDLTTIGYLLIGAMEEGWTAFLRIVEDGIIKKKISTANAKKMAANLLKFMVPRPHCYIDFPPLIPTNEQMLFRAFLVVLNTMKEQELEAVLAFCFQEGRS